MMKDMMGKMMGKMAPAEMQEMMQGTMGHMFEDMPVEDRLRFMRAMLQTCLPKLTEGMDAATRAGLVREIAETVRAPGEPPATQEAGAAD